jgi:DNA-binding response OmpR family regulator
MKRILIVDDDLSTTESIGSFLSESGYEIKTAANGIEALEVVKEMDPDLIITDVRMPKMNGFELFFALRSMNYKKPIIFISSYDNIDTNGKDFEVFVQMEKPINIFELSHHIKKLLRVTIPMMEFSQN